MAAFDEAELLDRVDNDIEFLRETVGMLATNGRALMKEVRSAAGAGDAAAMGRTAHTLKGLISNFAAAGAFEAADEVEKLGRTGGIAQASGAVERLSEHLEALVVELERYVKAKD